MSKTRGLRVVCILEQATYKPGDQAPEGYLAWHEWAEVQHKAGLRQKQCGQCGRGKVRIVHRYRMRPHRQIWHDTPDAPFEQ